MILDKVGRGNSEGGLLHGVAGLSVVSDEELGAHVLDLGDYVLAGDSKEGTSGVGGGLGHSEQLWSRWIPELKGGSLESYGRASSTLYNTESEELKSLCAICQLDEIRIHATALSTCQLVRGELEVHWSAHTLYVPCFVVEAQVKTATMTRLRTGGQVVP